MKMRPQPGVVSSGKHLVGSGKAKMPSEPDLLLIHQIGAIIDPWNRFWDRARISSLSQTPESLGQFFTSNPHIGV
jgi:hypothetical protein